MIASSAKPLFHCPRSADLVLHAWQDGVVVFDDANGYLQALTPAAGEVLLRLMDKGCASSADLALRMWGAEVNEEDVKEMRDLLENIQALGLVEFCPG